MSEVTAIAFGISLALEKGFCHFVLESNSKNAINLILETDGCLNEFDFVLDDIRYLSRCLEVVFNFIP